MQVRLETQQAFDTWLKPIVPVSLSPQLVELEVPNPFFIDWIHQHHLRLLRQSLREVIGADPEVRFTAREHPAAPAPDPVALPRSETPQIVVPREDRAWLDSRLNPRLTFASFVVGGSNASPTPVAARWRERPGEAYNPLFIFAGSGLGKTHLLHAIGHAVRASGPTRASTTCRPSASPTR